MKSKISSDRVAEELPSVKHQNYVSHCGLKKPLDIMIGEGKSQAEIRAAMILGIFFFLASQYGYFGIKRYFRATVKPNNPKYTCS